MTGHNKKMNYPEIYLVRVNKKLKKRLVKLGSKKIRDYLEKMWLVNKNEK